MKVAMGATFETVDVSIPQSQRDGKMVAGGATPGSTANRSLALWRSARNFPSQSTSNSSTIRLRLKYLFVTLQSQRDDKKVAGGVTPGSTNLRNQALWRSARIAPQANKPQTRSQYAFDSHLSSLSSGFFNQGSRTMVRGGLSPEALRLPRRYCERIAGASSCHRRNRGPCSLAGGVEGNLLSFRCHARGEIGIVGLDQRRTPSQFLCLARGLRSLHGERPRFGKGQKLYFESGRASSEGDFSGRVSGVSGAWFGGIRRKVFVVTGRKNGDSCAPSGHDKLEGRIQGLRSSLADPWLPSCRPSGTHRLRSSRSLRTGFAVPCPQTCRFSGTQRWCVNRRSSSYQN